MDSKSRCSHRPNCASITHGESIENPQDVEKLTRNANVVVVGEQGSNF
jgi:hypothetical protein